jgi:hypothetical protein
MKILLAAPADAKYRTPFQASIDYWRKEIERFWNQVEKINRTHLRRSGHFFSDDQLRQWQESQELTEAAMTEAINDYVAYLAERDLKPDKRWLRSTLEELFYGEEKP